MKKQMTLFLSLILGLALTVAAQNPVTDFVVVGAVSGDLNMKQVEMRYHANPEVYFTIASAMSAAEQISKALEGRKVNDLHIFVKNDQQGLFLTDVPVTLANAKDFSSQFSGWKTSVSGKVVIHNQTGIASPGYRDLLDKLKELTGLEIELKQ